jgi:hypothetical protein
MPEHGKWTPGVFLFVRFSALADRRQKEKFINRKSSGQPARKSEWWAGCSRKIHDSKLKSGSHARSVQCWCVGAPG